MGMFDLYVPVPPLLCPSCKTELDGWQGKDGPCALFIWKQGEKHPVDEPVVNDARLAPKERERFALPETFEIHTSCRHCSAWVRARGKGEKYIWTNTYLLANSENPDTSGGKPPVPPRFFSQDSARRAGPPRPTFKMILTT